MLGRQVGTSLLRLPRCARLPIRSLQQHDLAARPLAPSLHRFYADLAVRRPSRPKKAVGEPSRPVKRDVKRAAKSPKEDAATQKVKARKATAKKKVASPKKKELTEEQKARQASRAAKRKERLQKADIAELKKLALDAPRLRITNPWLQFIQEKLNLKEHMTSGQRVTESFSQRQKEIIQEYRNITPAEQEHYNHLAHTRRDNDLAAYKRWVESHTIEEIDAANKARSSLRRKLKDSPVQVKKWPAIKDERRVKRPMPPFVQFTLNRHASGDFKRMKLPDASKLIGQEWKALSSDEKKKYDNLYKQDQDRYAEEYTGVHGHAPQDAILSQNTQAAAAAA